jgi:hypothetical protein
MNDDEHDKLTAIAEGVRRTSVRELPNLDTLVRVLRYLHQRMEQQARRLNAAQSTRLTRLVKSEPSLCWRSRQ